MRDSAGKYRILVVGPAWVGDTVMAQSLFGMLTQRVDVCIDVLAPAWSLPLLARMPEVTNVIKAPFRHGKLELRTRYEMGRQLSGRGYHQSIVLPNSWKSALIPFWGRIPRRTGFLGEQRWGLLNDIRRLDTKRLPMTVQRFITLGLEPNLNPEINIHDFPKPSLHTDATTVANTLQTLHLNSDRPVLALCPGAEYGPSKCWPAEYFAEVARAKLAHDWQVWLLGSDKDAVITKSIDDLCNGECNDLAGRTTLEQVIDLLSLPTLVISNDSGLMHVAAAMDRPLVVLYGSTDPVHTPPLSDKSNIVYLDLDCSPCFRRECPLQHHNCMRQISPSEILTQAKVVSTD